MSEQPARVHHRISPPILRAGQRYDEHLGRYYRWSSYAARVGSEDVVDMAFGDPHEPTPPEIVEILRSALVPKRPDWFAYNRGDPSALEQAAQRLRREVDEPYTADHLCLTSGAFAGLATALRTVCPPGSDVIHVTPSWFYYEPMIASVGAVSVPVPALDRSFQLDLDAISAAITPSTSALIVNSPNNPTGAIYPESDLKALARLLSNASRRAGAPIYLISDEAYRRIRFGAAFTSPAAVYEWGISVYTLTKTLLLPGVRIGYLALSPLMPSPAELKEALTVAQLVGGWAFPNNSLQYALPELDEHVIDLDAIARRRARFVDGLRALGFEVVDGMGTFYAFFRSPVPDDWEFCEIAAALGVLLLPGCVTDAPGYVRATLTGSDHDVARAVDILGLARRQVLDTLVEEHT